MRAYQVQSWLLFLVVWTGACAGTTRTVAQAHAIPVLSVARGDPAALHVADGPAVRRAEPRDPLTFVEEDLDGDSPKFVVRDATGTLWKVKLGPEAQAETVATRLAWAMGYFAEGAYYRKQFEVRNLPALSRGRESQAGRTITRARFERVPGGDTGSIRWDWAWNPFVGSRELEGLKVLMMLLANYDARAGNNGIELCHEPGGRLVARYLVSDLGATLGAVGGMGGRRSKNDLGDFARAPFVTGVDGGLVTFAYRTRPTGVATLMAVIYPPYFMGEVKKQRDMNGVLCERRAGSAIG